jgi:UDP-N-acetylglucosamine--N-acetylmuramyl-(pentapeptide) pyrophosphoryl-undecaprenol N-acetylglucosamine transferase
MVPQAIALMPPGERPQLTHQSGAKHLDQLREQYRAAGVSAQTLAFIEDMAARYGAADLVICRAGALTVAELAAAGVGSVLIPFPHAVDDHQTHNARFLEQAEAAIVIQQRDLTARGLAELLLGFTREKLLDMAKRARALARPDATRQVAAACVAAAG